MYALIKRMYDNGTLDATGVANAVSRGWITQAQADSILGEDESED